jgi:hypothetical protein
MDPRKSAIVTSNHAKDVVSLAKVRPPRIVRLQRYACMIDSMIHTTLGNDCTRCRGFIASQI